MSVEIRQFGKLSDGTDIRLYTLKNRNGMSASIADYGGVITSLLVPNRWGDLEDVVLGYDDWNGYKDNPCLFGATIGRCANRIANAEFEMNGVAYTLAANYGKHHLHGGYRGFDKVVWQAQTMQNDASAVLSLSYLSHDGEEQYPGNLAVTVQYILKDDNSFELRYHAVTDQDTVVNLTNHSYFNLSGDAGGDICSHRLKVPLEYFAVIDEEHMPTGEIRSVEGTAMDFRSPIVLGPRLCANDPQLLLGGGFDHSWLTDDTAAQLRMVARLEELESGRVMEVFTTMPAVQIFTPDFSDKQEPGKCGRLYQGRNAVCFETNYVPNALAHRNFLSPILRKGQQYEHATLFKFSIL